MGLIATIRRLGRIAEPAPPRPEPIRRCVAPLSPGGMAVMGVPGVPDGDTAVTGVDAPGTGVAGPGAGTRPGGGHAVPAPVRDLPRVLRGSLQLRHVDAGSCNGCEIEIGGCFSPVYDAERYGARLVSSPRHADGLLVTGVVTHNMAQALRDTLDATPEPRVVIAVGDCARNCGEFAGAYGVVGAVGDVVPVDAEVPGCPPTPSELIHVLRQVTGR